jgi:hypothetical protein
MQGKLIRAEKGISGDLNKDFNRGVDKATGKASSEEFKVLTKSSESSDFDEQEV